MGYQLDLRHIRYFLAVADELHFGRAAERLFISQPGLSRQIKEMEAGLGMPLFERHNRKVSLTNAGRYLHQELGMYLKGLTHLIEHAQLLHAGLLGDLKIGYVGSAMQQIIPDLLLRFRQEAPDVRINLKEMDNQVQVAALLAHDIDLGFVRLARVPRGLEIHPLLTEPFCLVLPKDHPVQTANFTSLLQLQHEPFILFEPAYSPSYYQKIMQIFDDSGFSPIVTHSTIHANSIFKLVENHFGISIIPRSLKTPDNPHIQFIELTEIRQKTVLSVAWHKESRNPILGRFLTGTINHT